jgi:hypothetical protein
MKPIEIPISGIIRFIKKLKRKKFNLSDTLKNEQNIEITVGKNRSKNNFKNSQNEQIMENNLCRNRDDC